ncbi:MAG: ATP-binding protein [Phenylobacterium sp.]|uniref:ATP-binding protein n=1 Tax=Phenylobacterium sp. TaxID=1871053 RepID=UPI00391DC815
MHTSEIERAWTEIVAFRQRDRMIILPMTLLAACAAAGWLGVRFSLVWFAVNVGFMGASKVFCDWVATRPAPGPRLEWAMAAFTFAMTVAYCALPLALVGHGSLSGAIAGAAMVGAIALSSIGEFVISRRIGGAALGAMFVMSLAGALHQAKADPLAYIAFSLTAVTAFFFYVLQAALRRERMERQMAGALAAARRAETAAEAANAAKSAFLATMSHEIRTPLNGVLGMAQAMDADALSPHQRDRLAVIRQSGQTLTALLNDILDLSKIEAGQVELESISFDLEEVLRAGAAPFAAAAAAKNVALRLDVAADAAGAYEGDPTRLRQIVHNLVSNAVKFTEAGGVTVQAGRREQQLVLSVTDTGAGIAPDQIEKLFDKFVQLDASTTRRHGGTGLGLAICRDLCALMGGSIEVRSAPGEGSTFTAVLPLPRLAPRARDADAARPAPEVSRELRVLAAEDNAVNQLVLQTLLKQAGVEPVTVGDGAKAVEAWLAADWDVILMDVQMPVMDGLSAVREIRAREAASGRRRTPVIALTANAMTHQIAELRSAGMDAHVSKPIDVAALFAALEAVLVDAPGGEPAPAGRTAAM